MARSTKRFGMNRDRLQQMGAVAQRHKEWRPAADVITNVQAVPTIFPQYDIATRVMGHPIARFCRVRGPSNEGKTTFMIGLMLSFLRKGHFAAFADAERTTPASWLKEMMGDYVGHPGFIGLPVRNFEQCVDAVREHCETVAKARQAGDLDENTTGIIVVDSIRKLVPKNLLKELAKGSESAKGKGIDGFGGRAGQLKAALNAAWVDELIPLLADTNMAMCIIARETDDPDANFFDEGIRVGGGKALYYDSSLDIRVLRSFIYESDAKKEKGKARRVYGERHRIEIRKTKIGKKETVTPVGYFHTSNGLVSPIGFDRARDVLELGREHAVVELAGSSYSFNGVRLGVGEEKALATLRDDFELANAIEMAAREVACASW